MTLSDYGVLDRYQTRTSTPRAQFERVDPVVWGRVESPELATFDRYGYSVIDALLSPDKVAEFSTETRRLAEDPDLWLDERLIIEKKARRVRSIFEVHKLSAAVGDLVRQTRIAGLAEQILGSEVYLHQSRVNYMPGFTGAGFYWHSDFETWHAEDGMPAPRAVSLSIALTDNHPYNGSLMVMPGSHRVFVPCHGETPPDHYRDSLREQEVGVPGQDDIEKLGQAHGISQFTGAAGSALLFDSNLMHGSSNNITPFPRSNIFLVFNSVENTLGAPYAADEPRPTYIANRDFTPVR
ncbi:ectoine hydroxylase [Nocardia uniformis]|uniref:Ectoine hydroxylase n=1 Tax=Nocardia uniformis TaxID=53432 RepID=A0A849C2H6_9NOCA|nr:ectoine hydroxylase [Nocardia uniformis]NNH70640.1 ectoine hydroxylase [Nocardia uniformis]